MVDKRVLSLGAGVQSSVMALMLSTRPTPLTKAGYKPPDYAIFADTGWESQAVYDHLDWLQYKLRFPLHRVQSGNLRDNAYAGKNIRGENFMEIPLFTLHSSGKKGMMRRYCTSIYKIKPIVQCIREQEGVGYNKGFPKIREIFMYIGISYDEAERMSDSKIKWIVNQYPLVDAGLTRQDCIDWFKVRWPDRELPRSACVICPYRRNAEWMRLSEQERDDAISFDERLRELPSGEGYTYYLHENREPLADVFDKLDSDGVESPFVEECEGFCGL